MSKHHDHKDSTASAADRAQEMLDALSGKAMSDELANELSRAEPTAPAESEVEQLQKRVVDAETAAATARDAFLRARAETENVRRQAKDEISKARKYGVERFAQELLAVKDSLELSLTAEQASLEQLREGVALTLKQLLAAFEKASISEVNPQGQPFDPHQHQAVQVVAAPGAAPNTVVQVLQKGYLIHERVLRPAMVIVSKAD